MDLKIKTGKWKHLFLHLILMVVILIVTILLFFFLIIPRYTYHGASLTVPNLKGMSLSEAQKYMDERGLKMIVKDSIYKPTEKRHTILEQSPTHGIQVKGGRKIYLTITPLQAPRIELPNLIGMGFETAKRKLLQAGYLFGEVTYIPHPKKGNVLKMLVNGKEIKPKSNLRQGSKIDFVVGGHMTVTFEVPILVGLTLEEAETVIRASDLKVGQVKYIFDSDQELGTVTKQYPPAIIKNDDGTKEFNKIQLEETIDIWVIGSPDAAPVILDTLPKMTKDTLKAKPSSP